MNETPLEFVRRDDLHPVCPHCNERLTQVYYRAKGPGWLVFARNAVYFCPHCNKVLGLGQSKMA